MSNEETLKIISSFFNSSGGTAAVAAAPAVPVSTGAPGIINNNFILI